MKPPKITRTGTKFNFKSTKNKTMNFDINNLVRTVVIGGVVLPVALGATNLINSTASAINTASAAIVAAGEESKAEKDVQELRDKGTAACLDYYFSDRDSKLEREAKNQLDELFGGEINHGGACKYLLR